MREGRIIDATRQPNTEATLFHDLCTLGVRCGDILLVHSSLSSLGWVCGGAQTVILALLRAVGNEGTLVMPAHSGDWSDPAGWENPPVPPEWLSTIYDNMPAFDPRMTPTRGMGCIAELFRTLPGSVRSNHPQVSFAANGKYAGEITTRHPLTPQLGMDSPLGKIYHRNGKVLLLGVGYESCTSFHLAESLIAAMPKQQTGSAIFDEGKRVWKWFEDFVYNAEDFNLIGDAFEENHQVQRGKVGQAECRLFDMKTGVDFARQWLVAHRLGR